MSGITGIVVSTRFEAEIILRELGSRRDAVIMNKSFSEGTLGKIGDAAVAVCGVGKTNAAHAATLLAERFSPSIVYSIGVAGAYPSSGLSIGDVVVGTREIYGDEGLDLGGAFVDMQGLGLPLVPEPRSYNSFPLFIPDELREHGRQGIFITVSACTGTSAKGMDMEKRHGALCESMEGAAVAHVALLAGMPAVGIRAISNIIEDRGSSPLDRAGLLLAAENAQRFFLDRLA